MAQVLFGKYELVRALVVRYLLNNFGEASIMEIAQYLVDLGIYDNIETARITLHKAFSIYKCQELSFIIKIRFSTSSYLRIINYDLALSWLGSFDKVDLIVKLRTQKTTRKTHGYGRPKGRYTILSSWVGRVPGWLKEVVKGMFMDWLERSRRKVLVLRDRWNGDIVVKRYSTRFTDPRRAREMIYRYRVIWETGFELGGFKGVFLTLTIPHVIPIGLAPKVLSYMINQLKAWLRKKHGKTIPHLATWEFQENGYVHVHMVLFGIDRIEDKHLLTRRLDVWFVNAVLRLEKYGVDPTPYLDRYIAYCRKHKDYEGPINWVTKITWKQGSYEWNAPPDALKWFENKQLYTDGGSPNPRDYLEKYISKAYYIAYSIASGDDPDISFRIAMYWILNQRIISYSRTIAPKKRRPSTVIGQYVFLGSYEWPNMPLKLFNQVKYDLASIIPSIVII